MAAMVERVEVAIGRYRVVARRLTLTTVVWFVNEIVGRDGSVFFWQAASRDFDSEPAAFLECLQLQSTAAIRAMRQPTGEMIMAVTGESRAFADDDWKAMIDEALGAGEPSTKE